jgi:2-polyprenyl-6-hydroxyphenyl methylase/3-demethylubiquinone-9 3-methyltransferase
MQKNNGAISQDQGYRQSWWTGTRKFQRLLANQVYCRFEYFDRITQDWRGCSVLDLGCGFMSEALARRGARVIGIDPDGALLNAAREHSRSQCLEIIYREGSGEAIPLETASVDRVVCVDVLEHVQDVGKVIAEIRRVLRPGGLFFFDTINRTWLARLMIVAIAERLLRQLPRGAHDPAKFIRPEHLKKLLLLNGFTCPDKFAGMGFVRLNSSLDFEFGLLDSTEVMYIGYARCAR